MMKKDINKLLEAGYSQARIARICGISDAALSNYLAGKYPVKDITKIEAKIRSGVEIELKRLEHPNNNELPFMVTEASSTIHNVALICHTRGKMGLVYGAAGVGKTRACREYAQRCKNAIYIEARPSFTARTLMLTLARRLGINTKANQYELEEEIITKLYGSGKLVIIDEAEHLNHRAIETLRTVVYNASRIGLLLVGLEHLKYSIIGEKARNEYLSSRCLANRRIKNLSEVDVQGIVSQLFDDENIWKSFKKHTKSNMRLLENTVFEVQRLLEIPENKKMGLSDQMVKFAADIAVLS